MDILDVLNKLNIKYDIKEHKAVYTVEEMQEIFLDLEGIGCKEKIVFVHFSRV